MHSAFVKQSGIRHPTGFFEMENEEKKMKRLLITLTLVFMVVGAQNAFAIVVDLTAPGSSGTLNTGLFRQADPAPTGSGTIDSFVRLSTNDPYEQGYNTDGRPLQYDENSSPTFTRALPLSSVPIVTIAGVQYREFILDINQTAQDPLLSLNRVVVTLRASGGLLGATVADGAALGANADDLFAGDQLVYDSGLGNRVDLSYKNDAGSGKGDMFLYIPVSLFAGKTFTSVYLYSEFGGNGSEPPYQTNDGFEEWAVRSPTVAVPEPTSLLLIGIGLAGIAAGRRVSKSK
jgi:hypothetical protein